MAPLVSSTPPTGLAGEHRLCRFTWISMWLRTRPLGVLWAWVCLEDRSGKAKRTYAGSSRGAEEGQVRCRQSPSAPCPEQMHHVTVPFLRLPIMPKAGG